MGITLNKKIAILAGMAAHGMSRSVIPLTSAAKVHYRKGYLSEPFFIMVIVIPSIALSVNTC